MSVRTARCAVLSGFAVYLALATPISGQVPSYCVVEKGFYGPAQGPWNPGEMYSVVMATASSGSPKAIVQCFPTKQQADVAADLLLTAPFTTGAYGGVCERIFDVWVKRPEGRPALVERTGVVGRSGYALDRGGLCCDQATGLATALGRPRGSGCDCWLLNSVPGARVCRGADGRVYSGTGAPIEIPTQPPTIIPPDGNGTAGPPQLQITVDKACFAADPGAAGTDPRDHQEWTSRQGTDRLANNIVYKTGLLFDCQQLNDDTLSVLYANLSLAVVNSLGDTGCLGGDTILSPNWNDHYAAFRGSSNRREALRDNLAWKLEGAVRCLETNRQRQVGFFTNLSALMAGGTVTGVVPGGSGGSPTPGSGTSGSGTSGSGAPGTSGTTGGPTTGSTGSTKGAWVLQPAEFNNGSEIRASETSVSYSYAGNQFGPQTNSVTWSALPQSLEDGQVVTFEMNIGRFSEWKPTRYGFEAGQISGRMNLKCFASIDADGKPGPMYSSSLGGAAAVDSGKQETLRGTARAIFTPGSEDTCFVQVVAGAFCSDSCGQYSSVVTFTYKRRDSGK